jgi:nitronate monooxygenase
MMTERLSGTPCAVISTPYAKKLGAKQNAIEKWLSTNKRTRKYFKMLVQLKGFKKLEAAVKPGNYNNLWSAGQSVALIHDIKSCKEILEQLEAEMKSAITNLRQKTG